VAVFRDNGISFFTLACGIIRCMASTLGRCLFFLMAIAVGGVSVSCFVSDFSWSSTRVGSSGVACMCRRSAKGHSFWC